MPDEDRAVVVEQDFRREMQVVLAGQIDQIPRALGEAEAIRATGQAKAEAYRAGVESLGTQGYTIMQLMQIVGERNVRIVPDVAVSGNGANSGLVDGLLGIMLRNQTNGHSAKEN